MEDATDPWERLGLPALQPEAPWHGYSPGQWSENWDATSRHTADGLYPENGRISYQQRRDDVAPNTPIDGAGDPGGGVDEG